MIVEKETFLNEKCKERSILVGLPMDANGKELFEWAISRVAEQGDRVMAVHVCRDSDLKNATTLSLIKGLDDFLAAYEGLCNLKQVVLVGRVSRGKSIRKVLVREAKLCNAMKVIVGVNKHISLGGSASLAKYCAKKLPPTTAVIAVQNGKVIFERLIANPSSEEKPKPATILHTTTSVIQKNTGQCEKTDIRTDHKEEAGDYGTLPRNGRTIECNASSVSVLLQKLPETRLGWPLLRRRALEQLQLPKEADARKMSVVQWVMNLPNRSVSLHRPQLDLTKELKTIIINNNSNCRWFPYDELHTSTNQFSSGNLIGKGGSSQVYRGCLSNGQQVAIKLSKNSEEASRDFLLEVDIITKLDHKLIVPLVGICLDGNNLISVFNYFPKGSLEENLHGKNAKSSLPWNLRFKMAIGIAEALSYLHSDCSKPVIHRDVKSSNILLTDEFEPRLSDFGLAIWAPTSSTYLTQNDVVGTFGYLAPEYFMHGKISNKIDVFAFGVVLLELLTGRKPISDKISNGQGSLVMWATPILERRDFTDLLDPNLNQNYDESQMRRMIFAASLCITRRAHLRPQMREILRLLQGEEDVDEWMRCHTEVTSNRLDCEDDEPYKCSSIRSHLSVALLDVEDDASFTSFEQSNLGSLDDYIRDRWSRSSSFD
ncbi:putative receptor-like serine/threonine-protein kinase [Canna indica]|uniref:Receptor-like serine/threonine-protein kinase n=1 Tax=Canna indica TaxID=4628 RepID=A0AAQ3KGQ5_9LILI|nr:putative receptor-like serine/threonine-protein kinase [Canna indica]